MLQLKTGSHAADDNRSKSGQSLKRLKQTLFKAKHSLNSFIKVMTT